MDRLHVVISMTAVIFAAGCDDKAKAEAPTAPTSRVNAVAAKTAAVEAPADFCDVYHPTADGAPTMSYPELAGDTPTAPVGWSWVNVWATWCKPCIEEMPRLATWEKQLAGDGLGGLVFLSADETDEIVTKFRAEHPEVPDAVRIASPDALQPWLNGLGLEGSPSLPVHLFVDGDQKVRCIRMGGVSDNDRSAVERVLSGG